MSRSRLLPFRRAHLGPSITLTIVLGLTLVGVQPASTQSTPSATPPATPSAAAPPPYRIDTWTAENGLRGDLVLGRIVRSPDGYLWMRTPFGLTRFDGLTFNTFNADNTPLFANSAASQKPVLLDRRGRLWIATSTGLVWYRDGQFHPGPTYTGGLLSLAEDRTGALWGTMTTGALVRSTTGNPGDGNDRGSGDNGGQRGERMEPVSLPGFSASEAYGVAADGGGAIWVGFSPGGAVRIARDANGGEEVRHITTRDGLGSDQITNVSAGVGGGVWLSGSGHMTRVRDGRFITFALPQAFRDADIFDVAEQADETTWVATLGAGLFRYDRHGRLLQHLRRQDGLTHDRILAAFVDPQGSVWAATVQGLNRLRRVPFASVTSLPSAPGLMPGCLAHDARGQTWIGSEDGRLFRGQLPAIGTMHPIASQRETRLVSMADARDDGLWVVTNGGGVVHVTETAARPLLDASGRPVSAATSVFEDRRGALWIGLGGGLLRLQAGRETMFTAREGLHGPNVHQFVETRDGVLWAGGTEGMTRIEGDTLRAWRGTPGQAEPVSFRAVLALAQERDGDALWIGTQTGLTRMVVEKDGPRFATLRTQHGLPENWIGHIVDDGRGALWLLGVEGIARVPLAELHAVADGRKARLDGVSVFGRGDGLPSGPMVAGGNCARAIRDETGRLWFSMARGLAMVDPANMPIDTIAPQAHVVEARIDGAPAPLTAGLLTLPAGARRLEMRYTGVDLRAGDAVRFQHRLDGFDPDWVDAGTTRLVSYTNLRPGSYTFHLRARGATGVWSTRAATLALAVQPPFYRTWWFMTMAAVVGLGLAWLAHRTRERVIRARFDSVLAERQRVAREMHDTLLSGVAGIALRLDAASQRASHASETLASELAELRNLTRQMLLDARRAVGDLRGARRATSPPASRPRHAKHWPAPRSISAAICRHGSVPMRRTRRRTSSASSRKR